MRHRNHGLRKRCDCKRKDWPKCSHGWFLNFKCKGTHWRLSLDREVGRHVEGKTDAQAEADRIRSEIRAGHFHALAIKANQLPASVPTLEQLGNPYFSKYVNPKTGEPLSRNERYRWDLVIRTELEMPAGRVRLGSLPVDGVTRHHIQAFLETQRAARTETVTTVKGITLKCQRGGTISTNRCLERLRAFYTWAIENGTRLQHRSNGEPQQR